MPSRRDLLRTVGGSVVPFAGCVGQRGSSSAPNPASATDPPSRTHTETPHDTRSPTPTPIGTRSAPSIYVSEILPNPDGDDTAALNEEYVLIEMNADGQRDLSAFTLTYGGQRRYSFPDLVGTVASGSNLLIRSGNGQNRKAESEYRLFVGSDTPLLDNDGMQLTVRDGSGEVVDSVAYGALADGALWVRLE